MYKVYSKRFEYMKSNFHVIIAIAIFIAIIVKKEAEGRKIDAENAVVAEKIAEKHC